MGMGECGVGEGNWWVDGVYFLLLPKLYKTFASATHRVFCVCAFFSTVTSSPIASAKYLRVGYAKSRKRSRHDRNKKKAQLAQYKYLKFSKCRPEKLHCKQLFYLTNSFPWTMNWKDIFYSDIFVECPLSIVYYCLYCVPHFPRDIY